MWFVSRAGCCLYVACSGHALTELSQKERAFTATCTGTRASLAASGVDRTRYTAKRPISYKSHHTQRHSLGIGKADSRGILDSFSRLSASLSSRA